MKPSGLNPGTLSRRLAGVPGFVSLGFAIFAGLAFLVCITVAAIWLTTPRLENFLPANSPLAGGTDLRWWWDSTSDFRRIPEVQQAIAQADKLSHLSIETQIIPWIGQVGGAVIKFDGDKTPSSVICLQVRDWVAFAQVLARARRAATAEAGAEWQPGAYDGYQIERATVYDDPKKKKGPALIETAMVHGWLIIGIQPGGLEAALDTYTGRRASLASLPEWKKAQSLLPGRRVSWVSLNGASLSKQVITSKQTALSESQEIFGVLAFSDTGDGFRWDGVVLPQTPAARMAMGQEAGQPPVTEASLANVPDDANVTFLTSSGKGWVEGVDDYIKTTVGSNLKKQAEIADFQKEYGKYERQAARYLAPYTGPAGASVIFRPNTRCGAVAFATTAQPGQGQTAYNDLAKLDITPYPKWLPKFRAHKVPDGIYGFQPVEALDGNKLTVATAPAWLNDSTGHPHLRFPSAPAGLDFLVMGNFVFIQGLESGDSGKDMSVQFGEPSLLNALDLRDAQWSFWSATAPNGQYEQQCGEIEGWPWRRAERDFVTIWLQGESKDKMAASPHATHG